MSLQILCFDIIADPLAYAYREDLLDNLEGFTNKAQKYYFRKLIRKLARLQTVYEYEVKLADQGPNNELEQKLEIIWQGLLEAQHMEQLKKAKKRPKKLPRK